MLHPSCLISVQAKMIAARCLCVAGKLQARCRPHRPRAERMIEKVEVTPSAMSVQTQKKTPLELAMLPPTSPAPPQVDDKDAQPTDRPEEHDDVPRSPFPEHQRSVQPDDQD